MIAVMTPEVGWFDVLVQGVRRPHSQWVGAVEPFSWLELDYETTGRGFSRLVAASVKAVFVSAGAPLEQVSGAYVLSELIQTILPEHASQPAVYARLLQALQALPSVDSYLVVAWFRLQLLSELGFKPSLNSCSLGGEPLTKAAVVGLDTQRGGFVCHTHTSGSDATLPLSPQQAAVLKLLSERPVTDFGKLRLASADRESVHLAVQTLLNYHTERPGRRAAGFFNRYGTPDLGEKRAL